MTAELTTNKTVRFTLGGYSSNVITNSVRIKVDDMFKIANLLRESNTNGVIIIDKEIKLN